MAGKKLELNVWERIVKGCCTCLGPVKVSFVCACNSLCLPLPVKYIYINLPLLSDLSGLTHTVCPLTLLHSIVSIYPSWVSMCVKY